MKRAGLVGDPVEHSLSPVMHNAAFRHLGIDVTYEVFHTSPGQLADRIATLQRDADAGTVIGVNVTVPHKKAVMVHCDGLSDSARRIGAVNTLVPTSTDTFFGENTDAWGFARALQDAEVDVPGSAVVLGAGGAARAVAVALAGLGVSRVTIVNRTRPRAAELAHDLRAHGMAGFADAGRNELLPVLASGGDVMLVNATSLGWRDDECPLTAEEIAALPGRSTVVDLTYRQTELLRRAREAGLVTIDGLGMLLYQGVRALELWLGIEPPVAVMRAALLEEQARRSAM